MNLMSKFICANNFEKTECDWKQANNFLKTQTVFENRFKMIFERLWMSLKACECFVYDGSSEPTDCKSPHNRNRLLQLFQQLQNFSIQVEMK